MNPLLLITMSAAAKPDFCRMDAPTAPIEWQDRWGSPGEQLAMRALRPSLVQFQEDVCRCTPRRRSWPERIESRMRVAPSAGEVMVTYHLTPPVSEAGLEMLECLEEPTVTFEPFPFTGDMITAEGRVNTFTYTMLAELADARTRKRATP